MDYLILESFAPWLLIIALADYNKRVTFQVALAVNESEMASCIWYQTSPTFALKLPFRWVCSMRTRFLGLCRRSSRELALTLYYPKVLLKSDPIQYVLVLLFYVWNSCFLCYFLTCKVSWILCYLRIVMLFS